MSYPLVTVGVASYNNVIYLRDTLDSIKAQTYPNIEVLIVDDCSSDHSAEVAMEWLTENPTINGRLIHHEANMGVCATCNDFIAYSNGEYLSVIGSDDIYLSHKITEQVAAMQQLDDSYGMCYSDIIRIDEHGQVCDDGAIVMWGQGMPEGNILRPLIEGNFIPAMSILVRANVFKKIGVFDESICFEDWDMWLRIAEKYLIKHVPSVVAHYRVHGSSAMSKRKRILTEDSVKVVKRYQGFKELEQVVDDKLAQLARGLYVLDSPLATDMLWQTIWKRPSVTSFAYLIFSAVGIKYQSLVNAYKNLRVK